MKGFTTETQGHRESPFLDCSSVSPFACGEPGVKASGRGLGPHVRFDYSAGLKEVSEKCRFLVVLTAQARLQTTRNDKGREFDGTTEVVP